MILAVLQSCQYYRVKYNIERLLKSQKQDQYLEYNNCNEDANKL